MALAAGYQGLAADVRKLTELLMEHPQVPGSYGASPTLNFTMPPAVGNYPMTLGVIADVGQTSNSSQTWARMAAQNVQVATLVGDWTYADDYLTNGKFFTHAAGNNILIC